MKLCWATLTSFNKDNRVNIIVKKQNTMKFSVVYIFWEYAKKNFELNIVLLVVLVLESKCFYERRLLLLTSSLTLKVMVFLLEIVICEKWIEKFILPENVLTSGSVPCCLIVYLT